MAEESSAGAAQGTVTIDGTEYAISDLTEKARQQIANVRAADQELARLQQQQAIAQTARSAYMAQLREEIANR